MNKNIEYILTEIGSNGLDVDARIDGDRICGTLKVGFTLHSFVLVPGEDKLTVVSPIPGPVNPAQRYYIDRCIQQLTNEGTSIVNQDGKWLLVVSRNSGGNAIIKRLQTILVALHEGLELLDDPTIAEQYIRISS